MRFVPYCALSCEAAFFFKTIIDGGEMAIYESVINSLQVKTGDLICTSDGSGLSMRGQIWRLIGTLLPGAIDHVVVYVGPGGRCVEAGAKLKVITFEVPDGKWDTDKMAAQRGELMDTIYGIAYPLAGRELTVEEENRIRESVAAYCLAQAEAGKPYNINFLDSSTDKAFYCSQLAYKAYLPNGIDLNTGKGVPDIPGTESIIFPVEIWEGCQHKVV